MSSNEKTVFNVLTGLDFDGWAVPPHTQLTLKNYFFYGLPPGNFVEYMLMHANNLVRAQDGAEFIQARQRADTLNAMAINTIARFICEKLPPGSWGSHENIKNWMAEFGRHR